MMVYSIVTVASCTLSEMEQNTPQKIDAVIVIIIIVIFIYYYPPA